MRVLILGAGVIGVTSAWYLAKAGHEVTVVDRQPGPGLETSFANAGQVSPGYAAPWAAPGVPLKALRWLFMRHRPLVIWPLPDPALARFLAGMLRNCTNAAYRTNKARMMRLADYSRDCLIDLRAETAIAYDGRQRGTLQLFRTQAQLDHVGADLAVLNTAMVPYDLLDRAGCIAAEPALARAAAPIAGGLRLPDDETGDAHLFTCALAALAEAAGVRFRYDTTARSLLTEGGRVVGADTSGGPIRADRTVVALAAYSPALLRPLGIDLPVYPVKGYSLTIPIADPDAAPVSTVMDETYKVGITRLGDRIRVGGTAELAGFSHRLRGARRATLVRSVADLFPHGGDPAAGQFWTGLRPMTPDGTPIVGPTRIEGLFLNTGHGTLGWTMACGSGRLLADLISGRRPNIAYEDFALSRYAT